LEDEVAWGKAMRNGCRRKTPRQGEPNVIRPNSFSRLFAACALATVAFLTALPAAHATLTQLTVTLSDPTNFVDLGLPLAISDTVVVGPSREIFVTNPTNIGQATVGGSFLLSLNEYVDAQGNDRIVLGLEASAGDLTGYGSDAYYSFSNFKFSSPSVVTGISNPIFNGINPLAGQVAFANGALKILIGNVTFPESHCDGGGSCGTITVDLQVRAVPEPGTYALLAVGLFCVAAAGRRRIGR
jgi:hypothetical protein